MKKLMAATKASQMKSKPDVNQTLEALNGNSNMQKMDMTEYSNMPSSKKNQVD